MQLHISDITLRPRSIRGRSLGPVRKPLVQLLQTRIQSLTADFCLVRERESGLEALKQVGMSRVSGLGRFPCPESTPEVEQFCGQKSPDSPDSPIRTPLTVLPPKPLKNQESGRSVLPCYIIN